MANMARSSSPASSSSGLRHASDNEVDEEVYNPQPEDIAAYEELMAQRLPVASIPIPPPATAQDTTTAEEHEPETITNEDGSTRPMTKAEKQNAKKKRRKERERMLREAAAAAAGEVVKPEVQEKPVSYRLFSDVQPVYLYTKEDYPLTSCPRTRPLPPSVRARISRLAQEAALDPPSLPGKTWRRRIGLRATREGEVCDFEEVVPDRLVCDELEIMKGKGKRKITAYIADDGKEGAREGGRKRRKVRREFPPARFWRPEVENGFAYGW